MKGTMQDSTILYAKVERLAAALAKTLRSAVFSREFRELGTKRDLRTTTRGPTSFITAAAERQNPSGSQVPLLIFRNGYFYINLPSTLSPPENQVAGLPFGCSVVTMPPSP
jgi:hypothetical protein